MGEKEFFMKYLISVVTMLMTFTAYSSYDFQVGEEIKIQEKIWRRLQDQSGRSCMLDFLSTVKVEKIEKDQILTRYFAPTKPSKGTCENGITLSFEPHYLDTHRDYYQSYLAKKSAIQKIKNGLSIQSMGELSLGDSFSIPTWRWAVIEEDIGTFKEGDLCRVQGDSFIRIEGFYQETSSVLFKYIDSTSGDRECPEETLFFEKI